MAHAAPTRNPFRVDDVVELRQYTLQPRRRDVLIELFEREFVEAQEALGMRVLGQFRDLDDAARFVWLRGFADMAARAQGLASFYGGPVWAAHRDAANATMVDSDDVLLLRPAWAGAGLPFDAGRRAAPGATRTPAGVVEIKAWSLGAPAGPDLLAFARLEIAAALREAGAQMLGCYVTEPAANNFPRLPVREGERVLVVISMFDGAAAQASLASGLKWQRDIASALAHFRAAPLQPLRLEPTARSALHADAAEAASS